MRSVCRLSPGWSPGRQGVHRALTLYGEISNFWTDTNYLHGIENKMAVLSGGGDLFQREGRAYLADYPAFSKWVYFFYAGIFPLTVVALAASLLVVEFGAAGGRFHAIFDGFMWLGVATSFFLYRLWPVLTKKRRKGATNGRPLDAAENGAPTPTQ